MKFQPISNSSFIDHVLSHTISDLTSINIFEDIKLSENIFSNIDL